MFFIQLLNYSVIKKFEYIDSLRGIAILLVLVIHNGQHGTGLAEIAPVLDKFRFAGRYGVQLFFLVSAYTLMLSYRNRREENHATRNFFVRRMFRIMPMYYLAMVYYTVDSLFFAPGFVIQENVKEIIFSDVLKNVFFLNNFFPSIPYYVPGGWSVVAEIFFYVCLAFFIYKYAVDINKTVILFIISLILSIVFSALFINYHPSLTLLYVSFPNQLPMFIMGILLFYIANGKKISFKKWLFIPLLITIALYIYFIPVDILNCMRATCVLFIVAWVVIKKQYRIISNPFFSFIGKISFSMYLIHFGVLYWMSRFGFTDFLPCTSKVMYIGNYLIRYLVMFTITAGLSYLTYVFIEKFFIRKGKELIQRLG